MACSVLLYAMLLQVNLTTDSYVMVLTGMLPPAAAFEGLPGLRQIDIRMNALKGGLPEDWSQLAGQLEVIRLDQNYLSGKGSLTSHTTLNH